MPKILFPCFADKKTEKRQSAFGIAKKGENRKNNVRLLKVKMKP